MAALPSAVHAAAPLNGLRPLEAVPFTTCSPHLVETLGEYFGCAAPSEAHGAQLAADSTLAPTGVRLDNRAAVLVTSTSPWASWP